jgi:hypothetical protein
MGVLYGRAGRLNTKNAGFRPGQSAFFYGGRLKSAPHLDSETRPLPTGFAWPRPGYPVAFVPTDQVPRPCAAAALPHCCCGRWAAARSVV